MDTGGAWNLVKSQILSKQVRVEPGIPAAGLQSRFGGARPHLRLDQREAETSEGQGRRARQVLTESLMSASLLGLHTGPSALSLPAGSLTAPSSSCAGIAFHPRGWGGGRGWSSRWNKLKGEVLFLLCFN